MKVTIEFTPEQLAGLIDAVGASMKERPTVRTQRQAAGQLNHIKTRRKECFAVLTIDSSYRVIDNRVVSTGSLTTSRVTPSDVFADAISDRATAIIVAHNHPSGSLEPTGADLEVTAQLSKAGKLLGIELLDHLVITDSGFISIIEYV